MKRIVALILAVVLAMSAASCAGKPASSGTQDSFVKQQEQAVSTASDSVSQAASDSTKQSSSELEEMVPESSAANHDQAGAPENPVEIDTAGIVSLDELEARIEEDVDSAISALKSQWEILSAETDSFEKYNENAERISGFYETIVTETEQICIKLKEYSAVYARMILDSGMSDKDKYKAADGIENTLYEDACDEIFDEIYEGILDDMYDFYYGDILEEMPDGMNYSDWYDALSKEYDQWYDASSGVYDLYYEASSDIYSFYYDLSSKLYSSDLERAEKVYARFLQKLAKDKGLNTGEPDADASFDTTLRTAVGIEELEEVVEAHVSECVQALRNEWEALAADVDTFEKYTAGTDTVEDFHEHIVDAVSQILEMICGYGVSYAEFIMRSDSSSKDKYEDFEDFRDCIYDDACEIVKDEIYEDLLPEIKEYYYEGIIRDAKDAVPYSDWSDARSDAYSRWSDARSDVYKAWSDTRGDIYKFYSDIRGELFGGDIDDADKELENFRKKVGKSAAAGESTVPVKENSTETDSTVVDSVAEEPSADNGLIREDVKEAIDSYEDFIDEYCSFMESYDAADTTKLMQYLSLLQKEVDMSEKFDALEDDLNNAELLYYSEVQLRCSEKLIEVSQKIGSNG